MRTPTLVLSLLATSTAAAQPLIPGPGEPDHDATIAARIDGLERVQDALLSRPVGFGLEAFVSDPADRAAIEAFVASGERDFAAATGLHPYEVIDLYEEQGDLGMFGGVQAAGLAWRYTVLRDEGAPAAEVDAARAALLRAIEGLHWYTAVTGEPGAFARGIMRVVPEDGEPPIPFPAQEIVPFTDASGNPLPADKHAVWRADRSGELPFLIWYDDTSKDQFDGYILALGAVSDAIEGDASFDPSLVDRLREGARAIGRRLLRTVDVGGGMTADLVIVDADGRPTRFHDLSAEEVGPGAVLDRPLNGFNAVMSMGALRTIYHITGDEEIGEFYYQELVGNRDYFDPLERTLMLVYMDLITNYSNVNMAFVAIWGVLRYETDPVIAARMREALEARLYAPGVDREARGLSRPFFDLRYAGMREGGATDAAGQQALDDALAAFRAHPDAPYWNPAMINCDDAEIAAGSCVGVDGTTTIALAPMLGRLDTVVAVDPVPLALRPASNFEHRSDPHAVNGDANDRLNPAGDITAAYWMGRLLSREGGAANVSPHARPALPWTPRTARDAGTPGADAGPSTPPGGCGCRAARSPSPMPSLLVLAVLASLLRRRSR